MGEKAKKEAAIVVAHVMLRIAYYILTRKEIYVYLGEDFLIEKDKFYSTPFGVLVN